MPGIVIVGTGFGGIGMGIALKKAGFHDFVILDSAGDLGGTWRDNQYPGCACDVPSPLYSYSFELNPDWSHLFAPQQEIWDYLRNCARKYQLDEHIRYGTAVERMDWDDRGRRWNVETVRDGEPQTLRARAVVSAAGALHLPSYPDIPGAGRFGGTAFHSARWDPSGSLAAHRRYNDALQQRLRRAVWSEGGCDSWYLDAAGVNRTLWPGFTFEYWARTRRARRADYAVTGS